MNKHETNRADAPKSNDWGSHSHIQTLVLMAATGGGIYLCYRLALPFLAASAWALALAVLFSPFHRRLEVKTKHPSVAAAISVLIIGSIVVAPATFVGQRLIQESAKGAELIKTKIDSGEWRQALEARPRLAPIVGWMERQNMTATVKTVATWLASKGSSFVKGSMIEAMALLLTFYLLFFFLRDRLIALQLLRSLSPLEEPEMDHLFARIGDTIYATIFGTLAVAAAQGLLGGLMFWWLGLPAPLLWGVVMALLAVVPVLGAFVVWIPAALYLTLEGHWEKALILAVWGAAVVGTIDNVLRPVLVGNRLKLHTILAFMSVVGGLILFGPSGIILGPLVLTITSVLLEIWRARIAPATESIIAPVNGAQQASEASNRFENEEGSVAAHISMPSPCQAKSNESIFEEFSSEGFGQLPEFVSNKTTTLIQPQKRDSR